MAFPTISDADTKNGVQATNATTWTLTYPTNIAAGDLLVAFLAVDGQVLAPPGTWPSGWVLGNMSSGTAVTAVRGKKLADGSETGTFNVTGLPSESGGWRVFRIPAASWYGSLGTDFGNNSGSSGAAVNVSTTGTSSTPDPGSLDPADWATEDTLWFAVIAVDTSRTISVYPYADRNTADNSGGSGGATLGICTTTSAASSLNPGTFTISSSDDWAAFTVGIRPAAVAAGVPYSTPYPPLLAQ